MARRKPRVVWLPPDKFNRLGVTPPDPIAVGQQMAIGNIGIDIPSGIGNNVTKNIPLVLDRQLAIVQLSGGSLSDIENSGYRLRRIVGEIFVQGTEVATEGLWSDAIVTIGFIVLRVSETTGDPLEEGLQGAYSPQTWENQPDPWIWRRSWAITNFSQSVLPTSPQISAFPATNAQVSGLNGPHVDAKTARVLGPEERLFMVVSGVALNGNTQEPLIGRVEVFWDLRFLASMRTSSGNRRNASR